MSHGRVFNSIKNFGYGMGTYLISMVLGFVIRAVFISCLNVEYLGIEGLFTGILTVLSLGELGFGLVMNQALYAPLAQDDRPKIAAYLNLYSKAYTCIGSLVGLIGLAILPFLNQLISEPPAGIHHIHVIYSLFLLDSVFSYFFAYKRAILNADQKAYVCSRVHFVLQLVKAALQISSLFLVHNYLVFLGIQIACTFSENAIISAIVNRRYRYLKGYRHEKLTEEERSTIKANVKALIISNFSRVALKSSTNIIIPTLVGLKVMGLYSNYLLILGALSMVISQLFSGLTASLGNYLASEDSSKHQEMFERLNFLNFWLYGVAAICFYALVNPFISLWLGEEYIFPHVVLLIISANFLIEGFLATLWLFRTTMGLFTQGKYRPVFSAVLNISIALLLGKPLGLAGVLLATTFARLLVNFWYDPYIIYKHGLHASPMDFFRTTALHTLLIVGTGASLFFAIHWFSPESWIQWTLISIVSVTYVNAIFFLFYRNSLCLIYFQSLLKTFLNKFATIASKS